MIGFRASKNIRVFLPNILDLTFKDFFFLSEKSIQTKKENQKRIKKWPDIIGVGFPKCGTGAMAFLDCHSDMVFREAEGMLWHHYDREDCHPNLSKYPVPLVRVFN